MPGNHPSHWDFLILRTLGLWWLKWLWSGREVTSQGLSVASRGSEPLYLGKKNSTSVYEEVAVTTQMGHPSILPLEVVPPHPIPACVVWEGWCFSLLPWITCSTVSPVPGSLPGEGREKLEWPWCLETFHVFGYTQGMQRATLWTFVTFFCSASPRAPGGTRNLRNRLGNCTRSSSQLPALLRLAPSAVEGWVCDVSWKVGFVGVGMGGPIQAASAHFLPGHQWPARSLESPVSRDEALKLNPMRWGPDHSTELDAEPSVSGKSHRYPVTMKWSTPKGWMKEPRLIRRADLFPTASGRGTVFPPDPHYIKTEDRLCILHPSLLCEMSPSPRLTWDPSLFHPPSWYLIRCRYSMQCWDWSGTIVSF